MDDKDGRGLTLEKMRPTFSSFNIMPAKNHQNIKDLLWLVLPEEICLISSS